MTLQLQEGQVLCDRYTLLHKLGDANAPVRTGAASESGLWLAQDRESGDRVAIRVLDKPGSLEPDAVQKAEGYFLHALVHSNIVRTLAVDRHTDGSIVLVTAYVMRAEPFVVYLKDRTAALSALMPVLDALEYAHSLGLAHGNLSSDMILVDNQGIPHLLSFGFREYTPGWDQAAYHLSPQVRSGARPQPVDDIYSLGAVLFEIFTGNPWQGDLQVEDANSPMPESIKVLISSMLSETSYERPDSVSAVKSKLKLYLNPEADTKSGSIEVTRFERLGALDNRAVATEPGTGHAIRRETRTISSTVAVSAFLVLIVLIGGVFFYLPSKVAPVDSGTIDTSVTSAPATGTAVTETTSPANEIDLPAPFEQAQLQHFKEESKTLTGRILRQQITLEDSGALLWAKDEMQSAQDLADEGDLLFRDQEFEGSLGKYQQSLSILDALKASIPDVVAEHLAAGQNALETGDASTAINAFTIVLSIAPQDADAAASLARAQSLEEVLQLLGDASELEAAEQLQEALAVYQEARTLDPLWPAAIEGVARVNGKITQQKFNLAMSRGFSELELGNFDSAREAFSQAQALIPDSQLPADGLGQVDLAFRLQKIAIHKKKADEFALQENWPGAITEYQNALDLDSNLIFAKKGLELSRERLQLSDSLEKYIKSPLSLNDPDVLKEAKQVLYQSSMVSNPGKVLASQITTLSRHIKLARVPVEIELQSDKLTDIVVYKVGRLGKLKSTRLELYPGVYTVVGKRKGYRDVRKEITLLAGQDTAPVFIQCSEKI